MRNFANAETANQPSPGPIRLMREIRFSIDRDWATGAHGQDGFERAHPIANSWGGWPSAVGIAPFLVLRITVTGMPDPVTGYLINIQELDRLLRHHAIPLTARQLSQIGVRATGEAIVRGCWDCVDRETPAGCRLERLGLWTTPFLSYAIGAENRDMIELTQCFEFSASHRLHVESMSPEENRACFGKCNNPNGHGHNYQVEITIGRSNPASNGVVLALPKFEDIVKREVIDRLDHTHLNADVPEFKGVNPSVENIAKVVWQYLDGKFEDAVLRRVRVWETAKTYAEYSGG